PLTPAFLATHAVVDVLLVTAVVHVTGGLESQFAALYLLAAGAAALLLPGRRGAAVALLGLCLFFGDAAILQDAPFDAVVALQAAVYATVAGCTVAISHRLHQVGVGQRALVAELAQARLEAVDILRNIRSGILTVARDGRLLYANPAAAELLGLDPARLTGRQVLPQLFTAAPVLGEALQRAVEERRRTVRAEGTFTRDGRTFPVGVTTTVADGEAHAGGVTATAIFQDLSESKRAEALRLRAERLEAVAALSASLAHEIRNPLASIRSAVEQLARMPQAGDDERILAGLIVRESDRLARLLSEFLDFARVRVTRFDPLDLATVARGAASLAAAHPDRLAGVEVHCTTPDGPLVIDGDEDLLHRAVFNLALNAVQATTPGGRVAIDVAPLPPEGVPPGAAFESGAVRVRVSDSGPGIAPDVRDRLFDPFFTTKPGGTGLGLPVVHRAIEAHRGLVYVDSERAGTCFTVLLPARQQHFDGRETT
ncbi:MAG TPA: ATP-binding protein, partial [Gemmatimonadaceae bacterium]|nr:ATP-binding protein [Gemmatimonadaceae bacterium]